MNRRPLLRRLFLTAALCLWSSTALAIPTTVNQQGRLLDAENAALTGSHDLVFSLYDAESDGTVLWQGNKTVDLGDSGFYSVVLGGDANPLDTSVFVGGTVYMTLSIDGGEEMSPRLPVTSVPYAQLANGVADGAINTASLADDFSLDWTKIANIPADLMEGSPLSGLGCNNGQVVGWDGAAWSCVDVLTTGSVTLSSLGCTLDQVAGHDGTSWTCLDYVKPSNTLSALSCNDGQMPLRVGGVWACADGPTFDWMSLMNIPADIADGDADTLQTLTCSNGQVAGVVGANWGCIDVSDTLGALNCNNGQIPKRMGNAWACGNDTDTNTTYSAGNQLALNGTTFNVQDGPSSGLDADTLDGVQASGFMRTSERANYIRKAGDTMTGDLLTPATRVFRDKVGSPISTTTYTTTSRRLHVRNLRRRETLAIPHSEMLDLCGDEDGCTYRIFMQRWDNNAKVQHGSRGPYHFSYNQASGRWRTSFDKESVDGNNGEEHVQSIWDCCYFTEHSYISGVSQNDGTKQLYLLNWASSTCPLAGNLECNIVFDD